MESSLTQVYFEDVCQDIFLIENAKYAYSLVSNSNPTNKATILCKIITNHTISLDVDCPVHKAMRRSAVFYARQKGINNVIPLVVCRNEYMSEAAYIDLDNLEIKNLFNESIGSIITFEFSYNKSMFAELEDKLNELYRKEFNKKRNEG